MTLTVGLLAAFISLFVLLTVQVLDRAVELIVRNFAASRLITHHHAPIVHDSDTWLPHLPRSLLKYRKYPAIFIVMTCSVLLIPCELVTELGVNTSKQCGPVKETGRAIAPDDVTNNFTDIELASMAYLLQSTKFIEGPFQRVQAGLPREIRGDECVSCLKGPKHPEIISGCSVKMLRTYNAGELEVTIQTTNTSFKTITSSFNETKNRRVSYNQAGDVTKNSVYWASIMFQRKERKLLYLEYANQDHIYHLSDLARRTKESITEKTKSITRMYSINCSMSKLNDRQFDDAVRMYRVIQLENPVRMTPFNESEEKFAEITSDVIYRAVLAVKLVDDRHEKKGEFYRYISCGSNLRRTIPFTSRSWFHNVMGIESGFSNRTEEEGPFDGVENEMVLVEEGRGIWKTKSVVVVPQNQLIYRPVSRPVDDMEDYDDDDDDLWTRHQSQVPPRRFGRFRRDANG